VENFITPHKVHLRVLAKLARQRIFAMAPVLKKGI
jgi:hypothetical protein